MSTRLLYVVLSSRTSFSLVTGPDRFLNIQKYVRSGRKHTLLYDRLIKRVDIGGFDVLAPVLLESGETIPDTQSPNIRQSGSDVMKNAYLIRASRIGNSESTCQHRSWRIRTYQPSCATGAAMTDKDGVVGELILWKAKHTPSYMMSSIRCNESVKAKT